MTLDSNDINISLRISIPLEVTHLRITRECTYKIVRRVDLPLASIIWSLHHSFNVFHARRDTQAARGWHGCRRAFGETTRSRTESNAIVTPARCFYQGFSSLLSPNTREVQHVRISLPASLGRLSLHLSYSLLISRPSARPSLSIIAPSRPFSPSLFLAESSDQRDGVTSPGRSCSN